MASPTSGPGRRSHEGTILDRPFMRPVRIPMDPTGPDPSINMQLGRARLQHPGAERARGCCSPDVPSRRELDNGDGALLL